MSALQENVSSAQRDTDARAKEIQELEQQLEETEREHEEELTSLRLEFAAEKDKSTAEAVEQLQEALRCGR